MMIRFLDGYAAERQEELDERKIKQPLTKSYLLESACDDQKIGSLTEIMNRNHITLEPIDDQLYRVYDRSKLEYMGFLERSSS
jgi:hypothetical protein